MGLTLKSNQKGTKMDNCVKLIREINEGLKEINKELHSLGKHIAMNKERIKKGKKLLVYKEKQKNGKGNGTDAKG